MREPQFIPYQTPRYDPEEMSVRAEQFYQQMNSRRSVRQFSSERVPRELIDLAIRTASTAPSGAHRQPWQFVAISDPAIKRQIREATEAEERISYEEGRMPREWLVAVEPFGTDWRKPFLETAPWLVVVFEETHGVNPDGSSRKNYYVKESVGIACGLFITALHNMGLATLTHTPSPMEFLSRILERPRNERPFMLFPIGYPDPNALAPDIRRKSLDEIAIWRTAKRLGKKAEK